MPTSVPVRYVVAVSDLHSHYFDVSISISKEATARLGAASRGLTLRLPAWIPGSYMIRDFSKHLESFNAKTQNRPIRFAKTDSHTWQLAPFVGELHVSYRVYAFDTSVRSAYLDASRGFFNATSLCLEILKADLPCELELNSKAWPRDWQVVTTLPAQKINASGFGIYRANSYDELIDHPVALGSFQSVSWRAHGVPHQMMIQGAICEIDTKKLAADLKAICESQIAFFDPKNKKAPFHQYCFIVNAVGDGYGGLEHRNSTVLLCKRDDLPYSGRDYSSDAAYQDFLGLCSHEYFHAWVVKRIKPKAFAPYELSRPNHSTLLWLFEGFTSYYDDLHLFRSQRIDLKTYLKRLEKTWNLVLRGVGRHKQSVAQSSFDAWTKYYQMDENTPNSVVSYYAKGSLIALALDLQLRHHTKNKVSLDDVMRHLWQMNSLSGEGIDESDIDGAVLFLTGSNFASTWQRFKADFIHGTKDLPLEQLLTSEGFQVSVKSSNYLDDADVAKQVLGIRTVTVNGWVKVSHVMEDGWARSYGLASGDYLSGIGGERVTPTRLDGLIRQLMRRLSVGEVVLIQAYRHERLLELQAVQLPNLGPVQYQIGI
jgi:predicted metalloprotease with PDZ domain